MSHSYEELTLFANAIRAGDAEEVRRVLSADPSLANCGIGHNTPLTIAAGKGQLEICAMLIEAGADLHKPGGDGHTPLGNAAIYYGISGSDSHKAVVDYLAERGAVIEGRYMGCIRQGNAERAKKTAAPADDSRKSCYIATACYGSYDHPDVRVLRRFRDERLLLSATGRWIVSIYYAVSPRLAARIGEKAWLSRTIRRRLLEPLVRALRHCQPGVPKS